MAHTIFVEDETDENDETDETDETNETDENDETDETNETDETDENDRNDDFKNIYEEILKIKQKYELQNTTKNITNTRKEFSKCIKIIKK